MQQPSSEGLRRLVVMRHAKAEPTAPSDHDRALAARGRGDAAHAGRWLREQGIVPDAALVSDALRTRQTWEEVALAADWETTADLSGALYAAGPDSAFDLIRDVHATVTTLLVIGHNPTMASIAELIDDGEGDPAATTGLVTRGFPTSALAVFAIAGEWADLGAGAGRLEAFHAGDA
ncbi:phosphohistidine phosphatase [Nocardioides alpinus]|uniref:Histidine phosphatase family protein n=1 Tax=Nocardioides alpinus TaxID=748909 RepID=A0A1I0ZRI2_9ACTN|nr:histidine phosphatase family protein [Nocardioides alpinus]PKH41924.1 histidine phosphatase family protein [Nocardioides alpinus]SFB26958.1 phosphohistidine phosphatase [Nocardioides alpinus]